MEAPSAHNSSIKVHFGDKAHKGAASPLHLSLTLDFFSEEEKNIRQQLQTTLNTPIPPTAIVFEIVVSSGNGKDVAEKLNNSQIVKEINENSPTSIIYHGHENKLYTVINSIFEVPQEDFASAKQEHPNGFQPIQLNISSNNDLGRISELLKEKGVFGLLDSLEVNFEFAKTNMTEAIIITILEKMGFSGISKVIKSFKRLNFELNGASSSILNEFPKVVFKPFVPKTKNDISSILTEANISEAHIYFLNKALFVKGRFEVNGLTTFISTLYN